MQTQGVVFADRLEQLTTVIEFVERQIATWNGRFQRQALRTTTGRQHAFVQGRFGPAGRRLEVQVLVAFLVYEVENLVNGVGTGLDLVLLNRQAKGQTRSCLLYTSPSPRDGLLSRMPSSA